MRWSGNLSRMKARNQVSTATSTSVTRSIAPFLSMRMPCPKRAICISPACRTASTAVESHCESESCSPNCRRNREPRVTGGDLRGGGLRLIGAGGSFFIIRTSMPPSGTLRSCTSSMKLRMKKMPRPLDFRRFSGASGLATSSTSNPSPWSMTLTTSSVGWSDGMNANSMVTCLASSRRLPCLMALITDSRTATPTQWMASSSRPASCPT